MPDSIQVGLVGGTGYAGAELLRLLLGHPAVSLGAVVSRSRAGERIDAVHPGLAGFVDGCFVGPDELDFDELDVLFLAVPHGAAGPWVERADEADVPLVIDLSRDHRHAEGWIYGQAEWHHALMPGACRIAVPGCFATAISLALAPFVQTELAMEAIQVVAATGSTGSGGTPSKTAHHPERFVNMKAYKVLSHQHVPEITEFLAGIGPAGPVHFVPFSAPVDRGILAACFVRPPAPVSAEEAKALLEECYADHPLVRVRDASPELRHVRGTALCDLSVYADGEQLVVLSALDNLGKGAAAQAVQCLNLSLGLPTHLGVGAPPCLP